jgi:hypothetical protein
MPKTKVVVSRKNEDLVVQVPLAVIAAWDEVVPAVA